MTLKKITCIIKRVILCEIKKKKGEEYEEETTTTAPTTITTIILIRRRRRGGEMNWCFTPFINLIWLYIAVSFHS